MDKLGRLDTENEKRAVIQKTLRDNGLLRKERCIMVKASFEKREKKAYRCTETVYKIRQYLIFHNHEL